MFCLFTPPDAPFAAACCFRHAAAAAMMLRCYCHFFHSLPLISPLPLRCRCRHDTIDTSHAAADTPDAAAMLDADC